MKSFIYFIRDSDFIKIGYTTSVKSRLLGMKTDNPHDLTLLGTIEGGLNEERAIHKHFARFKHRNEWFHADKSLLTWIERVIVSGKLAIEVITPPKSIPAAEALRLSVRASCDPRTLQKVFRDEPARNLASQRAKEALIEAGYLTPEPC